MELNQRLSERMMYDAEKMGPEDINWNQFVRDHKDHIKSLATTQTFDTATISRYRYRPEEFYVDHDGLKQITWIFLLINDIRDITEFTEQKTTFLMISKVKIRELYSVYSSSVHASQETAS